MKKLISIVILLFAVNLAFSQTQTMGGSIVIDSASGLPYNSVMPFNGFIIKDIETNKELGRIRENVVAVVTRDFSKILLHRNSETFEYFLSGEIMTKPMSDGNDEVYSSFAAIENETGSKVKILVTRQSLFIFFEDKYQWFLPDINEEKDK